MVIKICERCEEECEEVKVDESFHYEYGDECSVHQQYGIESNCCGAEVISEEEFLKSKEGDDESSI